MANTVYTLKKYSIYIVKFEVKLNHAGSSET